MTHHKIHYLCKFCGAPGVALAALDCPDEWIDKLAPGLCCNRCGDAAAARTKAEDQIFKACHFLKPITLAAFKPEQAANIRGKCRTALEKCVPAFCEAVCDGHRLQPIFEHAFIDDFYQHPEKAGHLIGQYRHRVREIAQQPPISTEKVFL